jgi:transcriptional regulator with XRE-family HTH domain
MLARLREGRGLSQRALARGLGFSHTLVVRSEAGTRPPADAGEVLRVAGRLDLDADQTDELLMSAGYWPAAFIALGPHDPTLRRVAGALLQRRDDAERARRLRRAVDGLLDLLPDAPGFPAPATSPVDGTLMGVRGAKDDEIGRRAPES